MKPVIMAGVIGVNLALVIYAAGVIAEQRSSKITRAVISFLTVGVLLDFAATLCMLSGTDNSAFTIHGLIGYSALAGMMVATILAWRHRRKRPDQPVTRAFHLFLRYAFAWWLVTWLTGIVTAMSRRAG